MKPLAIAVGDPGGVGPEVSLRAAAASAPSDDEFVLYGDARHLNQRATELGLHAERLRFVHVGVSEPIVHGPARHGGELALLSLDRAIEAALSGEVRGVVTGPVSKQAIALSLPTFVGQTEHLAMRASLPLDAVTMLFLGPRLNVGLVTTHVAISRAPAEITPGRVARTAVHLAEALLRIGAKPPVRVLVTGLNPHAGEGGRIGTEDLAAIAPGVVEARARAPFASGHATIEGPLPSEAALRFAVNQRADGVVAMIHDQATIPTKLIDFGYSVNVTWGLPFVRTSVDHGVAFDAAARGEVDSTGMESAIRMAQRLTSP